MQKNYGIKFAGIGVGLPAKVVKNTDLEKLFETSDEWIFTRTGIKERRIVSGDESGLSLSLKASLEALQASGKKPEDIDLIIVCTATPDKLYPSMSCLLQGELGASNAVSFDLSAACSGFVFGLVTASQYIYSGTFKNILLVGTDVHSRFVDWSDRSVAILFGDGAGAVLISRCEVKDDELLGFLIKSDSDKGLDLTLSNENINYSNFSKETNPDFVSMNGKAIYQFAVRVVPEVVTQLSEKLGIGLDKIDYFIPHQANKRIIDMAAKKLGFKESQVISNIDKVGNTSAASIPLALYDALKNKQIKPSSKIAIVGFGAGLTWGSAFIDWKLSC